MLTFEGLEENFRFLTLEVENLVDLTVRFLNEPTRELFEKINSRDDYVDNLKNVIENKCFSTIHSERQLSRHTVDAIRSLHIMCVNLERIADFCVNVTRQMEHFDDPGFILNYPFREQFDIIRACIAKVQPTREDGDLNRALEVCKSEFELDGQYKAVFDGIMAELELGGHTQNLVTALFIFRYIERIGDSLLNIGEALIFSILGEKIKIEQYEALKQTLDKTGFKGSVKDLDFTSIWGSRSGCRIGRMESSPEPQDVAHGSLYKEGVTKKIKREKDNIDRWGKVFPGIGPRVFSYHEDGAKASLLMEFLAGCTLDEVILTAEPELVRNAMFVLTDTLREIWSQTKSPRACNSLFMRQLESRLPAVRQVHPGFDRQERNVGLARIISTGELLSRLCAVEDGLPAPFSMLIHGDFNTNNVVYNHDRQRVHFIDLYRSDEGDYTQDVAVFLVSNFRVPLFGRAERDRLNTVIRLFHSFAMAFAAEQGDATFQARLAMGLARSLLTSTRFELNARFAKEMFMRSHFLMEKLLAHDGAPWESFQLPTRALYY